MAYEALNNAASTGGRLIVVLNDNAMSIAPPVGAMSDYLSRLRRERTRIGTLFEDMGFEYVDPIDGHDLDELVPALVSIGVESNPGSASKIGSDSLLMKSKRRIGFDSGRGSEPCRGLMFRSLFRAGLSLRARPKGMATS